MGTAGGERDDSEEDAMEMAFPRGPAITNRKYAVRLYCVHSIPIPVTVRLAREC